MPACPVLPPLMWWNPLAGHLLPLVIALYCAWSLRRQWRTAEGYELAILTCAGAALLVGLTRTLQVCGITAVLMPVGLPALLAVVAVVLRRRPLDWRAVWLATFVPTWLLDWYLGYQLLGGFTPKLLRGIGGAGFLDGLLLMPILGVLAARVAAWELRRRQQKSKFAHSF
jgi:hypothetical protein